MPGNIPCGTDMERTRSILRVRCTALIVVMTASFVGVVWGQQETTDPLHFTQSLAAFDSEDRLRPPPERATLYVGGAAIRRWASLPLRAPSPYLQRGIDGAELRDLLRFADRLIIDYAPKTIYLHAGGNDLQAGRTAEEVAADLRSLLQKVRASLAETRIAFLSILPVPRRWSDPAHQAQILEANRLAEQVCREEQAEFIDLFSRLLDSKGEPQPDAFLPDGVHLSERGYRVVTSALLWQKAIEGLEGAAQRQPPPEQPIVFVGSSSIARWKTLAGDFPDLPVVNHGFGGSEIFDTLTYLDRIVLPFRPRMVVMYAGSNDIHRGQTPDRVAKDLEECVQRIHQELPECQILYISIAGNPARWGEVDQVREANRQIRNYAEQHPRVTFLDVFTPMLGEDGLPRPEIFVADRLHMNERGYALWKELLEPYLRRH